MFKQFGTRTWNRTELHYLFLCCKIDLGGDLRRQHHKLRSVLYSDTHAACGTSNHAHSTLDVSSIQVRHLHLSDLTDLIFRDGSNFGLVRNSGTGFQVAGFLQQNCCRRGLGDEAEASVRIYSDDNGDDQIALLFQVSGTKIVDFGCTK